MPKASLPATAAIRALRHAGVSFEAHPYQYEEKGGTAEAARQLHVDEHRVVKTLVMEDESRSPLIVLMHGDQQVSTKALARALGAKSVTPCDAQEATRHTGYRVGGISPFGTRKRLPIYVEASILELTSLFINGGRRGLMVEITPEVLVKVLNPIPVQVAR